MSTQTVCSSLHQFGKYALSSVPIAITIPLCIELVKCIKTNDVPACYNTIILAAIQAIFTTAYMTHAVYTEYVADPAKKEKIYCYCADHRLFIASFLVSAIATVVSSVIAYSH